MRSITKYVIIDLALIMTQAFIMGIYVGNGLYPIALIPLFGMLVISYTTVKLILNELDFVKEMTQIETTSKCYDQFTKYLKKL